MATIKDVAKLAGVSVNTVSRAFNNRGYIGKETRIKIEEACMELNYQPNEIARSLFKKKSNIIGVIIPRLDSFFFSELIQQVEDKLYSSGYKMLLCSTNESLDKEKSYLAMFKAQKVDGVIIGSYLTSDKCDYSSIGMPAVAFDRYLKGDIRCVTSDHYMGGELATKLLIDNGAKKIAHFRGDSSMETPSHEKVSSIVNVCEKNNVDYCIVEKQIFSDSTEEFYRCLDELNKKMPDYDSLIISDYDACLYLNYADKHNIKVPEDVQIVGYDGLKIGEMSTPKITSIAQSFNLLSERLVNVLLSMIEDNNDEYKLIEKVDVELIKRETTK